MNFRGINSIFHSQALKLESFPLALKLFRKENQLQHHPTHHRGECQNLDSEKKTVFVLCSSYKPPPQTFDHQKFKKGGLYAGIYGTLQCIGYAYIVAEIRSQNEVAKRFLEKSFQKLLITSNFVSETCVCGGG